MKTLVTLSLLLLSSIAFADFRYVPGVRVTAPPPAIKHEVPPPAPSRRHQWIAGYWGWSGGKHVWREGHWALPPHAGYVWEPARWSQESGAWVFSDGHWRTSDEPVPGEVYQPPAPPATEVVVDVPPPAPIVEIKPPLPYAGAVWIPGYWQWHGKHHVWVGGRWSAPAPGHHWVGGTWEHNGNHYVQRHGYWERDRH